MISSTVSLIGGPPWGFRISQNKDQPPFISQVIPEGRAFNEGIQVGDFIESVNGENCWSVEQVHNKMHSSQGVLRLKLRKNGGENGRHALNHGLPLQKLKLIIDSSDTTPDSSAPQTPSSQTNNKAAKPPILMYNGGSRGSAQEKKRFFEQAIARQVTALPPPLTHDSRKQVYNAIYSNGANDNEGIICGNDEHHNANSPGSIAGVADSNGNVMYRADETTYDSFGYRLPPCTKAFPPYMMQHNYRPPSTTPIAIEQSNEQAAGGTWDGHTNSSVTSEEGSPHSRNQNTNDMSTDSGVGSTSSVSYSVPPPPPPPTVPLSAVQQGPKKWQVQVNESESKAVPRLTTASVATGRASGEVEIPRPQSVAELRAHLATKLEVRNPTGQRIPPVEPGAVEGTVSIVHPPAQAYLARLTPTPSVLSIDQGEPSEVNRETSLSPTASSASRLEMNRAHMVTPVYGPKASEMNDSASDVTPHHSRHQLQHAALLHPAGTSNRLKASTSLLDLSRPAPFTSLPAANTGLSISQQQLHLSPFVNSLPSKGNWFSENTKEEHLQADQSDTSTLASNTNVNTPLLSPTASIIQPVDLRTSTLAGNNVFEQKNEIGHRQFTPQSFSAIPERYDSESALNKQPQSPTIGQASNRLEELIELARKTFSDETGRQRIDPLLESSYSTTGNINSFRASTPMDPAFNNITQSSSGGVVSGYDTLPTRGRNANRLRRVPQTAFEREKSAWYRDLHKQIHQKNSEEATAAKSNGMSANNLRPITPQAAFEQQQRAALLSAEQSQRQRRAQSVGRYDPVADMDILERWAQQKRDFARSQEQLFSPQSSPLPNSQPPPPTKGSLQTGAKELANSINEMKKLTMEEILQRQRSEKLSEELDDQRSRRHGYFPGASPVLYNNVQRFDHLLNNVSSNVSDAAPYSQSRCSTPGRRIQAPIQTATVLYKFVAHNARELSLNRGDTVRVHGEIDANWLEGERNGQAGIFPASYVQIDEDPSTSRNRVKALYPFQARNRNELSLKKGEILRQRREIDGNWLEGTNSKGQIGIFPKCYVQEYLNGLDVEDDAASTIPDRPKTPKIITTNHAGVSRTASPSPSKKGLDRLNQIQRYEQQRETQGFTGTAKLVPKNSETYRALYAYKPEHSDELELQEDDIVFVVEKCDDGWYIGTLLRNGQFGTFPGNYVEKH